MNKIEKLAYIPPEYVNLDYYEIAKMHIRHIQDFIEDTDKEFIEQNYDAFFSQLRDLADFSDALRSRFAEIYIATKDKTVPDTFIDVPEELLYDVRHSLCAMDALWEERFGARNHNGDTIKKINELLGE